MRFEFAIGGEGIVRDVESDKISLFNLLEDSTAPGFPVLYSKIACMFVVAKETGDAETSEGVYVGKFDDTEFFRTPAQIDFKGRTRQRLILQLMGFVVPRPCLVSFALIVGESELGKWEFRLEAQPGVRDATQAG
jgi:hypothetical protein